MICQEEFDLNIIFFIILFYLGERRKMKGGKELATDCLFLYIVFWSIFAGIAVDKLQLEYVGEKNKQLKGSPRRKKNVIAVGEYPSWTVVQFCFVMAICKHILRMCWWSLES